MGSAGSKAQAPAAASTSTNSNASQPAAGSRADEAIGMVIDSIVLLGMFVTAKYVYKVRASDVL